MGKLIELSRGLLACVDEQDIWLVHGHKWHAAIRGRLAYAATRSGGKTVLMHRLIAGAKAGELVDHKDGNGLNNIRKNLRIATPAQNATNRTGRGESKFPGVKRSNQRWVATVCPSGSEIYLGSYEDEEAAAAVSYAAAIRVFGEFVRDLGIEPAFEALDEEIKKKRERAARIQREIDVLEVNHG